MTPMTILRNMATSRWWLMRWPRNATALLVHAGSLTDDEASKLFRALRETAVRFGLELAALPKARHDAKEATDARTALRKRWVATVDKLGPGYRTKRGAEMPDWVAVAHLPSYKVQRTLQRWSVEVPRAIMPNRQRTMQSFYTATGARVHIGPAPPPPQLARTSGRVAETEVTGHRGTAPGPQRITPISAVSGGSEPLTVGTAVTASSPSACTDDASSGQMPDDASALSESDSGTEANEAEQAVGEQSYSDWARRAADEAMAQHRRVVDARSRGAAATLRRERHHGISRVPAPWGVAPQQDALRGVITSYDSDGRCSYAATHKCYSTHDHWSRTVPLPRGRPP